MHDVIGRMWSRVRGFLRAERGNVAMMFGIALVPICIAAGVGLDYARSMVVRQQMADALDAAALAVGSTTGLNSTTAQTLAQKYFNANYSGDTSNGAPTVTVSSYSNSPGSVTLNATYSLPTTLLKVVGKTDVPVSTSTTVVWGQSKLWVSLVLDNTGSMSQTDSTGTSKISALKSASHQLLTILQNAATTAGDVQVAIVPFARDVKVGTANVSASWIDWTDWEAPPTYPGTNYTYAMDNPYSSNPATVSFEAWGPGDNCPFTDSSNSVMNPYGFKCQSTPTNGSSSTSTIPSSGTWKGYICPGSDDGVHGNSSHRDRYYNGCYTSTKVTSGTTTVVVSSGSSSATCNGFSSSNCSCTGSGTSKVCSTQRWTHAWVVNNHSTWSGCVMDRTQNYDTQNAAPTGTALFPAVNETSCPATTMMSLNYNWTNLSNEVDAMTPNGSTNQTIGLAHGWQTQTAGDPYGAPTLPSNTSQYIILVSDGLNTQDRWYGDGSSQSTQVDNRMAAACTNAKAAGMIIYTIFVDLGGTQGNSSVLQSCASDSTKYFDLTTSGAIVSTFNQIAQQITNVRVSQ